MSAKDDGEPAFPLHDYGNAGKGMQLRDWFAGQALAPYIVWSLDEPQHEGDTREVAADRYARFAYTIADAMLKARQS